MREDEWVGGIDLSSVYALRSNLPYDDEMREHVTALVTWYIRIHSPYRRALMRDAMRRALIIDIGLRERGHDVLDLEKYSPDLDGDQILDGIHERNADNSAP